jgi:predicted tellurium resistance membrane protein TerC
MGLYVMSLLGLIVQKKKKGADFINLLIWVVLGWVGVHIIIETQSRYRYFAMPFIAVFAAIGMYEMTQGKTNKIKTNIYELIQSTFGK